MISDKARVERVKKGLQDPVWFLREHMPHLFTEELPWPHRGTIAILTENTAFLETYGEIDKIIENFTYTDQDGIERSIFGYKNSKLVLYRRPYTEIMWPRGFGKTSLAGVGYVVMATVHKDLNLGVYVSETGKHSRAQLHNVKNELTANESLLELFGNQRPKRSDDEKWTEEFFETVNGVAWYGLGRGEQIRGKLHKGHRPQFLLFDDLEDLESVSTETQREKTRKWFYGDFMPALPRLQVGTGRGRIVGLGTMLHQDCLLERVAQDPRWSVIRLGALDKSKCPIWPAALNENQIELEKQSYARAGQLHTFYLEYFNEARAAETQRFREDMFIHSPVPWDDIVATGIYCDPAISKSSTADDSVILVGGRHKAGPIYVLDGWGKRGADQYEVAEEYFRLHKLYRCRYAGIETVAYQAALAVTMREQMFRKGYYFEIDEVNPVQRKNLYPSGSARKSERILGILQPRFGAGAIIFSKTFPKLKAQLLDYQPGDDAHDDWPDCLAGLVIGLDPTAAYAAGEDPEEDFDAPIEDILGEDLGCWA